MLPTKPEPDRISLRMPLIPRRRRVLALNREPLAHVERRRIKPCNAQGVKIKAHQMRENMNPTSTEVIASTVYVDVMRDAWPPPELLMEISPAACATRP